MTTETEQERSSKQKKLGRLVATLAVLDGLCIALVTGVLFVYDKTPSLIPPWTISVFFMGYGGLTFALFFALTLYLAEKDRQFWNAVAQEYGYTYVWKPYFQKEALRFQEGRNRATRHGLMGTLEEQAFRLFQYSYETGYGKHSRRHFFVVLEVTFEGTFPHLFLNNVRNTNLEGLKEFFLHEVTLPAVFDSKLKLYVPEGYEIEALEIFTPDILALLFDEQWHHDVELVGNKLFVFEERYIRTKEDLQQLLGTAGKLVRALAPRLNRFSLHPIGDLKHTL